RGDFFEGTGEVGLHYWRTDRRRLVLDKKRRRAARVECECRLGLTGEVTVMRGGGEAVARKADRLGEEIAPRQSAKALMHGLDPGEHTGDRYRERPDARNANSIALRGRSGGSRTGAVEHDSAFACW